MFCKYSEPKLTFPQSPPLTRSTATPIKTLGSGWTASLRMYISLLVVGRSLYLGPSMVQSPHRTSTCSLLLETLLHNEPRRHPVGSLTDLSDWKSRRHKPSKALPVLRFLLFAVKHGLMERGSMKRVVLAPEFMGSLTTHPDQCSLTSQDKTSYFKICPITTGKPVTLIWFL
jgi:hypothetical protein